MEGNGELYVPLMLPLRSNICTDSIDILVGPRAGLNVREKGKITCPDRIRTADIPDRSPVCKLSKLPWWLTSYFILKKHVNLLKPTGYVMHHKFNIQQLYALPTLYLCVLCLSENKQRLVPLTA